MSRPVFLADDGTTEMAQPASRGALLPPDEDLRLQVLHGYDVLDTGAEQEYDDLVHLAAMVCGTPVAAISLVDTDRQWFKAKVGLELSETPRDQSFCAHAILDPQGVLEVPDAFADERFANNPLVLASGGIRFYAGTPLVADQGQPLGALCVIDDKPGALTADQRRALEALGRQVVAQLELRRRVAAAEGREQQLRESEASYRHLSLHDPLTGLGNRSAFRAQLTALTGQPIGLCFLDLDHFKQVNDVHGHEAGDRVLRHVAEAILAASPSGALAARLGGDEFVVLCPGLDGRAMQRVAARIVAAVEEPVPVRGLARVVVGVSAGWTATDGTVEVDEAVRRADRAMYDAKAARRRRRDVRPLSAGHPAAELRRALDDGELMLHYQPFHQVRLRSGRLEARVTGAEALVRWQHPEHGLVMPDAFVPLAERTGLIAELGRQVLEQAVTQTAAWERAGVLSVDFRLHVNLAAQQLHSGQTMDAVLAALGGSGLAADRLCLEVTESALLDVNEFTAEAVSALTELGVHLALDDFGTGYSSLTQLRSFPFDVVKVDRSFVAGLADCDEDDAVVEAVVQLAHRLGIRAVAEGVETVVQLRRLLELGCNEVQGYLLGRPTSSQHWQSAVLGGGWRPVPDQDLTVTQVVGAAS